MNRLIKFNIRNMFRLKSFYICLALLLLMGPILNFATTLNTQDFKDIKIMPQIISLLNSEVSLFSVVFIVLFSCLDFTDGTTKNIIGRGYTRLQLLFSKYIVSLLGMFIYYIFSFIIISCLFGINGIGYENTMLYIIINDITKIIALVILYVTIAFIVEKNGFTIIICLLAPTIIQGLLILIDTKLGTNISNYWITNLSAEFLNNPTISNLTYSNISYIIYIIITLTIGINIIKKREIK